MNFTSLQNYLPAYQFNTQGQTSGYSNSFETGSIFNTGNIGFTNPLELNNNFLSLLSLLLIQNLFKTTQSNTNSQQNEGKSLNERHRHGKRSSVNSANRGTETVGDYSNHVKNNKKSKRVIKLEEESKKANERLDSNNDGKVSVEEYNQGTGASNAAIVDSNGDGIISEQEQYNKKWAQDSNYDGVVSAEEAQKWNSKWGDNNDKYKRNSINYARVIHSETRSKTSTKDLVKIINNHYENGKKANERLDSNNDGKVSVEEYNQGTGASNAAIVDSNGDGIISDQEQLSKKMSQDKNNDGKATAEEAKDWNSGSADKKQKSIEYNRMLIRSIPE